jgi:hypothetical protein
MLLPHFQEEVGLALITTISLPHYAILRRGSSGCLRTLNHFERSICMTPDVALLSLYPASYKEAEQIITFADARLMQGISKKWSEAADEAALCRSFGTRSLDCQHPD